METTEQKISNKETALKKIDSKINIAWNNVVATIELLKAENNPDKNAIDMLEETEQIIEDIGYLILAIKSKESLN